MKLLNVRCDDRLFALVDAAAAEFGAESRSDWIRHALEAAARLEMQAIIDRERQAFARQHGVRDARLGFVVPIGPSGCGHPAQARRELIVDRVCLVCGKRWSMV